MLPLNHNCCKYYLPLLRMFSYFKTQINYAINIRERLLVDTDFLK